VDADRRLVGNAAHGLLLQPIFGWGVYGAWAGFTTFVRLCGVVFAVRFVNADWLERREA